MYSPRPREMNGRFEGKCFTFVHAIHSDLISRFDVSQRRRIFVDTEIIVSILLIIFGFEFRKKSSKRLNENVDKEDRKYFVQVALYNFE